MDWESWKQEHAAAAMGTGFALSTWSTTSIEEISSATGTSIKWMQVYFHKDLEITKQFVKRAEDNGYTGIILTVDTPVVKEMVVKHQSPVPSDQTFANFPKPETGPLIGSAIHHFVSSTMRPSSQWKDVAWLQSITNLPIAIKGILNSDMANRAVEQGVDGIIVSNHGGRTLDGVSSTIDALREIVEAVNGRCEVYMDGGIRTGTDVLKAIALGAKAVFVGRPILWGLACDSQNGVENVLKILRDEFKAALQFMGCRSIEELQNGKDLVVPQTYYN